MTDKTPEQLLSEALRAKAVQTPSQPAEPPATESSTESEPAEVTEPRVGDEALAGTEPEFELLSGRDGPPASPPAPPTAAPEVSSETGGGPPPLRTRWILLLALVLGAAAGAVAALLTLG